MKVGILSQWYDPETGPAALPGIYAREFVNQGHQVSVLTGFPNYPSGEIYPGYRQTLRGRSRVDGAHVTRVPLYPDHGGSALGRLTNYASFAASATLLGGRAFAGADAIWVYNSPITVSLPLLLHSRWGKTPIFLHVQDLWPDSLLESGMFPGGSIGAAADRIISMIVRLTERQATRIGVISESVREIILSRNPAVDPAKIIYVPNPTDESLFRPADPEAAEVRPTSGRETGNRRFELMYVGAVGDVQGLDCLVDAAVMLRTRPDIRITIVGDGISRASLQERSKQLGLDNLVFRGRVGKDEVPALIVESDAQLVSLGSSAFLRHTTPSKIASLLASGIPIIGHIAGDGADLIKKAGAGVTVSPGDPVALAQAIEAMADMTVGARDSMARNGRAYYESQLSSERAAKTILESLASAPPQSRRRS